MIIVKNIINLELFTVLVKLNNDKGYNVIIEFSLCVLVFMCEWVHVPECVLVCVYMSHGLVSYIQYVFVRNWMYCVRHFINLSHIPRALQLYIDF